MSESNLAKPCKLVLALDRGRFSRSGRPLDDMEVEGSSTLVRSTAVEAVLELVNSRTQAVPHAKKLSISTSRSLE